MQHVRQVLQILQEHKLQVKEKKSYLGHTSVPYIVFVVISEGIQLDPTRIQELKQIPLPSSAKELKIFLGGINCYRNFIPSFSNLARPLHHLSNTSSTFIWTKEETTHFSQLKDALCSSPVYICQTSPNPLRLSLMPHNMLLVLYLNREETPFLTTLKPCLRQRNIIVPMTRNFIVWCKHSNNG
jgi:hypothetical protein